MEALQSLALSLRADPRDPIESLPTDDPGAGAGTGPRFAASGGLAPTDPSAVASGPIPSRPTPADPGPMPIDVGNLERLRLDLQSEDDTTREMAQGVLASLTQAKQAGGVAQLLVYESADSWSQGRAAISVGDISTADNVATLVPGITSAPAHMADGVVHAVALRAEASRQSPGETTAAVAWYGYDIPLGFAGGVSTNPLAKVDSTLDALDDDNAGEGGVVLARDIDRFLQWAPVGARFTALGFSNGLDHGVLRRRAGSPAGRRGADGIPGGRRGGTDRGQLPAPAGRPHLCDRVRPGSGHPDPHRPGRDSGRHAAGRSPDFRAGRRAFRGRSRAGRLRCAGRRRDHERARSPDVVVPARSDRGAGRSGRIRSGQPVAGRLSPFGDQLPVRPFEGGSGRGGTRPLHGRSDQARSMTPPGPRAAVCGHDGQVRIDNPDDIRDYYAAVAGALIPHLAGRPVTVGTADGSLLGVERIDTADDLDYLLRQGAVTLATALPDVQRAPVMPVARTVAWCTLHVG